MPLPEDQEERKKIPLYTGLVKYFPDALIQRFPTTSS